MADSNEPRSEVRTEMKRGPTNTHVARLTDFKSARRMKWKRKSSGVSILYGRRGNSQTDEPLAYGFDADTFSPKSAKAWLAQKDIPIVSFRRAVGDEEAAKRGWKAMTQKREKPSGRFSLSRAFDLPFLAPGKFQGVTGPELELSVDDLRTLEGDMNALIAEGSIDPPAVLTHDAEMKEQAEKLFGTGALGRIRSVFMRGHNLVARIVGVSEAFADAVRRGVWRPRSATLERGWKNPITGKTYPLVVREIAWLGSQAPAVPLAELYGLAHGAQTVTIAFADANGEIRDQEKESQEMSDVEKKALEDATREKETALAAAKASRAELYKYRLESLVADRRIKPDAVEAQQKILMELSTPAADAFLVQLAANQQLPDLTQRTSSDKGEPAKDAATKSEKKGGDRLHELALELRAKNSKLTYGEAFVLAGKIEPQAVEIYTEQQGMSVLNSPEGD